MHTRESLNLVQQQDGHPGLREIGRIFGVKSVGSDTLITKILQAQNGAPKPSPSNAPVQLMNLDDLTAQRRNTEVPWDDAGAYFPPLVSEDQIDSIKEALTSFAHQWTFNKIEFFLKFQSFRVYKNDEHVDWVDLNQIIRMYQLKIPLAAKTIARRLYTAPIVRAYK